MRWELHTTIHTWHSQQREIHDLGVKGLIAFDRVIVYLRVKGLIGYGYFIVSEDYVQSFITNNTFIYVLFIGN